jgi:formylglycine-generating enzyme required for sulfatase activity
MRRALAVGLLSLVGCTQLLGVESIPSSDAGSEGGRADSTAPRDVKTSDANGSSKRCALSSTAVETFEDGGWVVLDGGICTGQTPICLAGACRCVPGTGRCVGGAFERCEPLEAGPDFGVPEPCGGTCSTSGCGPLPPSCALLLLDSGATVVDDGVTACPDSMHNPLSCCASQDVPGGTFYLSYDGVTENHTSKSYPRSVSGFRLDRYEVTLGRFRPFVNAVSADAGVLWLPEPGSGKHTHLNGGNGLRNPSVDGGGAFESGWDPAWNAELRALSTKLLQCGGIESTWTPHFDGHDNEPVNCLTWVEAYAFCIWDGGFLPTEAEWNYAAAAGAEQRVYPWGNADAGCSYAEFVSGTPCQMSPQNVGLDPLGDSLFGQADMAGGLLEWTLDAFHADLATTPQTDVAVTDIGDAGADAATATLRVQRGGSFVSDSQYILTAQRGSSAARDRSFVAGVRCARVP